MDGLQETINEINELIKLGLMRRYGTKKTGYFYKLTKKGKEYYEQVIKPKTFISRFRDKFEVNNGDGNISAIKRQNS